MDADSFFLALSEKILEDIIPPEKQDDWNAVRLGDWKDFFTANRQFFPRMCFNTHKKHDKREPGLLKEDFRCTEILCLCSKTYCRYDWKNNKYKFSNKGLNKRSLEDYSDGPMSKYRKVLHESVKATSTNRGFRTVQQF